MDFKKAPKKKISSSAKKIKKVSTKTVSKRPKTKQIAEFNTQKEVSLKLRAQFFVKRASLIESVVRKHARTNLFSKINNLWSIRRLVIFWLSIASALILSVGVFRIYSRGNYKQLAFVDGGIYSEGIIGEIKSLNPLYATSEPEKAFSKLAFSRLFDIDSTGNLNTELVQKYETNDNYKNIKIKLKDNATWSDDTKLTADDVIFTINLLKDKYSNPSRYQSWKNVNVSKKGEYDIEIATSAESSLVLYSLIFPILPKHKLESVSTDKLREDNFSKNPITSGVFNFNILQSAGEKTTIGMVKNKKYFGGVAKLDRFEIVSFSDREALKKALVRGEISATPDLNIGELSESEKLNLSENKTPVNRGIYAFMNNSGDIFKDKNVRQAVSYGLDFSKIRDKMGYVDELNLPVLSEFTNSEDISKVVFDRAKAAEVLENAGWKKKGDTREKDGSKLSITLATVDEDKLSSALKEISEQLKTLGFEVKTVVADKNDKSGSFIQSVVQARNYDILIYEIDLGADSDIYAFWHSSQANFDGLNFSNYKDFVADDLLLNIRKAKDYEARKSKITSFSNRWLKEVPAVALGRVKLSYVFRNSVKAYSNENILVDDISRYADVKYWASVKDDVYKTP